MDMGRNIFQAENPPAMIQAVGKVVHESFKPQEAYQYYQTLKAGAAMKRLQELESIGRPN